MIEAFAIAIAAGIDQIMKTGIEHCKEEFPREVQGTKGKLWLYQNKNKGFPFGFLQEYTELTRIIPVAVTSALGGTLFYMKKRKKEPARRLAIAVIIGGSLSNILDRYVRGYVVDYFSIRVGKLKKVVMNFGDVCVFAGTGVLILLELAGAVAEKGKKISKAAVQVKHSRR